MNKNLPKNEENEIKNPIPEETSENTDLFSDWSNLDAASIYRVGSESKKPVNEAGLNQSIKETKSFLKIATAMIIVVFIILIIVSSYY